MDNENTGKLTFNTHTPAHTYPCKILVTYIFTISRPPKGMAGYIDWIMNGHISNLILKDKIKGHFYESILLATTDKIKASMTLIIGAGNPHQLQLKKIRTLGRYTGKILKNLKISHFGLYPHDLFLSHLDRSLLIGELINGFKDSISNDMIIGLLSSNQEQKEIIERWLLFENHENFYIV